MAITLIHVSDIHFGSGEVHGKINPASGLNIRFEDFVQALAKVVDYAIEHKADVFLFSGDAYRNASPEPIYQKFFARELKRLSDASIQTVLVVGNHDQIMRSNSSHAMSVFQSLEVPGIITIDKPTSVKLNTANGALQLIGLPHITRHQLMTMEKYANLPAAAIDRVLIEHITDLLRGYYEDLDPEIPTVVTAHMGVDSALAGIEQELLIGYTLTFPAEMFIDKRIDYVALGHIHRHQVIRKEEPAIVYAGSLERVDFGEEKEDKGFLSVSIERGKTAFEFCSITPRPFITISVDLTESSEPMSKLSDAVKKAMKPGCVLRIKYILSEQQMPLIEEDKLRQLAHEALTVKLQPEIVQSQRRARLPQLTESSVTSPMMALETYLDEVAPERKDCLLERARDLMADLAADLASKDGS
jgi:DNA repair protein SbcD/Mre11